MPERSRGGGGGEVGNGRAERWLIRRQGLVKDGDVAVELDRALLLQLAYVAYVMLRQQRAQESF